MSAQQNHQNPQGAAMSAEDKQNRLISLSKNGSIGDRMQKILDDGSRMRRGASRQRYTIDDVSQVMLAGYLDDLTSSIVQQSRMVAGHRQSDTIEAKDIAFILAKKFGIHVPGHERVELQKPRATCNIGPVPAPSSSSASAGGDGADAGSAPDGTAIKVLMLNGPGAAGLTVNPSSSAGGSSSSSGGGGGALVSSSSSAAAASFTSPAVSRKRNHEATAAAPGSGSGSGSGQGRIQQQQQQQQQQQSSSSSSSSSPSTSGHVVARADSTGSSASTDSLAYSVSSNSAGTGESSAKRARTEQ